VRLREHPRAAPRHPRAVAHRRPLRDLWLDLRARPRCGALKPSLPTFGAAGAVQSGTGALTVPWDGGVANNSVGFLLIFSQAQSISLTTSSGSGSSAWTQVGSTQTVGSVGTGAALAIYWARSTGTTPFSPVVAAATHNQVAYIVRYEGVARDSNPFDVQVGGTNSTGTTAPSVAGTTTLQQLDLVMAVVAYNVASSTSQYSAPTNASLSSVTLQNDTSTAAGGGIAVSTGGFSAGGAYSATTGTLATSGAIACMSVAVKPKWTIDASAGQAFPAGPNEWADFLTAGGGALANWSAPNIINGCQDASGNVTDQSGSGFTMTATGTGLSYANSNAGYSRKSVNFTSNSTGAFTNTSASLPNLNAASCMQMLFANVTAPSAIRGIAQMGTPSGSATLLEITAANHLEVIAGSGANHLTGSASPCGSWQGYFSQSNFATTKSNGYDNLETLQVSNSGGTGQLVRFGTNAVNSPTMAVSYHVAWFNAAAERSSSDVANLEAALGITRSWTNAWVQAIAESVSAPTDSVARAFVGSRAIAESVSAPTDAVARAFAGSRGVGETITAPTDAVARALVLSRAIAESVPAPTDSVARAFVGSRGVGETITAPTDAVARAFAGSRAVAESVPAPTDAAARALASSRGVGETITAPTDSVARAFTGSRGVGETITAPTDAVARAFSGSRGVGETITAPTDAVAAVRGLSRAVGESILAPSDAVAAVRGLSRAVGESIPAPSDAPVRQVAARRSVAEATAAPTDAPAVNRGFNRAVAESVPAPTDAASRTFRGARSIAEGVPAPTDRPVFLRTPAPIPQPPRWRGSYGSATVMPALEPADNVRTSFTTMTPFLPGSVIPVLNGLIQSSGWTETGDRQVTFAVAPRFGTTVAFVYAFS
jgi:hypothetical protein